LAAALLYFAGGSPYDIAGVFGISVTEVHQSVWRVVNAVNHKENTAMHFEYPADWVAQRRITASLRLSMMASTRLAPGTTMFSIDHNTLV
jgi:hypothetical protein